MEAIVCSYSRGLVNWLTGKFPATAELDSSASGNDEIIHVFQLLLPAIEFQATTQGKFNLNGRIKEITGIKNKKDQLVWLLSVFASSKLPEPVKDLLYGQLKIFVKWKRSNEEVSETSLQLVLPKQPVNQEEKKSIQSMDIIKQKLNPPILLPQVERSMLLDGMKISLAQLFRETDPITFGDPGELEVFDMGRGLGIALVGMKKEKRLSLENYIGYMVFKNGLPVAYGGGWIWGQRCRIGISIYPSFRKGESAWLFAQVLRLYYQYYNVRDFIVRQNQFGEDNLEGLKTGAFWFYYKLGFRPQDKELEKLAGEEWIRIKTEKNYRTSLKTLRMFATGPMGWSLSKRSAYAVEAEELSRKVSDLINQRYNCSRTRAFKRNNDLMEGWSFLLDMLDDFQDWNPANKKKLTALIYLKQAGSERDHIIGMQDFPVFWKGMKKIVSS